ncbi:hypothetical protein D3C72_1821610 [compost metagenome]
MMPEILPMRCTKPLTPPRCFPGTSSCIRAQHDCEAAVRNSTAAATRATAVAVCVAKLTTSMATADKASGTTAESLRAWSGFFMRL